MTDTTTPPPDAEQEHAEAESAEATPAVTTPSEPVSFWHRPNIERYVVPIVVPVLVIFFVIVFILAISRIFLSAGGHIPIFLCTGLLLLILIGATLMSRSSDRLSHSARTMLTVGFVLLIISSGWLLVGKAAEKNGEATALAPNTKTSQTISLGAAPSGQLKFTTNALTAKTGLATISVKVLSGGHTFAIEDPSTLFTTLDLNATGSTVSGPAFFPHPGTYAFKCTVDDHAAAGMQGTITVTGPPMTLAEAQKAAGG
jgi:plastocyanin